MKKTSLFTCLGTLLSCAGAAHAWHFDFRFVERVGGTDIVLPGNTIDASDGAPRRIRIQMGVFDDAGGPALPGGVLGWNSGSLTVSGAVGNSDETRTPGRLGAFAFPPQPTANGSPPLPAGDPFTSLTLIDAALGIQNISWFCGPDGQPLPPPEPVIRGLNSYVSTFEFTIDPNPGAVSYSVTAAGFALIAREWQFRSELSTPPDCTDPENPVVGSATYIPLITPPPNSTFSSTLTVIIPAPGALPLLAAAGVAALRRRR